MNFLVEHFRGCNTERAERLHVAGLAGKRALRAFLLFHMKHLQHRDAVCRGLVDELLHVLHKWRDIILAPIRTLLERLLDVDDEKGGFHAVSLRLECRHRATATAPGQARFGSGSGQKRTWRYVPLFGPGW